MKPFNATVICTKSKTDCYTKGSIYKIVDGKINSNYGISSLYLIKSLRHLNNIFASQFKYYKEDNK